MPLNFFLAQISEDSAGILTKEYQTAQQTQEMFSAVRDQVLSSPIFATTSGIAAGIVAICIGWYVATALKSHSNDEFDWMPFLQSLGWAFLIAIVIGNPTNRGSLLGQTVNSAAWLFDNVANSALKAISGELNTDVISAASIEAQAEVMTSAGITRCMEEYEGNERDDCLVAVVDKVQDLVDPFQRSRDVVDAEGNVTGAGWARRVLNKSKESVAQHLSNPNAYLTSDTATRLFTNATLPRISTPLTTILFLVGAIFAYVQSIGVVVMALWCPIALALSLSPLHRDSFKKWATGFINLALLKLAFFMLSSLAAWYSLLGDIDPTIFPLVVAISSLVMSFQILIGGGTQLALAPAAGLALGGTVIRGARSLVRRR